MDRLFIDISPQSQHRFRRLHDALNASGQQVQSSTYFDVVAMYDLVISPEPFLRKCRSLAGAKNPFLEVRDRRIRLAWTDGDAIGFMERAESIGLGISYDMLEEALSEAEGTVEVDGRYPLNATIRRRLGKLLNPK